LLISSNHLPRKFRVGVLRPLTIVLANIYMIELISFLEQPQYGVPVKKYGYQAQHL